MILVGGIGVAQGLSTSTDPFLMAIAIGASCTFLTSIGHQSNTRVMGPGGYKFGGLLIPQTHRRNHMDTDTLMFIAAVALGALTVLLLLLLPLIQVRAWSALAARLGLTVNRKGPLGWSVWLQGEYQGHPVIMDTYTRRVGKRRSTFTRIIMQVSNPAGLRLELAREGLLEKAAQAVFGKDIQVGDAELDKRLTIRGEPEEAVRRVLSAEALRQPLLSAAKLDVRLEGEELIYRLPGVEKNGERLRAAFDLLAALATEVGRAG